MYTFTYINASYFFFLLPGFSKSFFPLYPPKVEVSLLDILSGTLKLGSKQVVS